MPSKVEQMRNTLLTAIEQVRTGVLTPEKASAMAKLAHQVNASLDVELRVMIAAKVAPSAIAALPGHLTEVVSTTHGTLERSNGVTRHRIGGEA
jgi:hypothetical protein